MLTTLTVAGTGYAAGQRAGVRVKMDELSRTLGGGYDQAAFHEDTPVPVPKWHRSQTVVIAIDGTTRFQGEIVDIDSAPGGKGWVHAYTAEGLGYQADRVPVTAVDGTGTQIYNRTPDDPYYIASDAGLTIGQIFTRILTIQATANALNALGVGGYTSLAPPTLPAALVSDLALLTIVPPNPVVFVGENILSTMQQHLVRWMPKYEMEVDPAGLIHFKNVFDTAVLIPRTLTVAGPSGTGDPVTWPRYKSSTRGCYTRVVVRGSADVEPAVLSTATNTLKPAWSNADQTAWTLYDFTQPKDATDTGTISAMTSNTATVSSDSATEAWPLNFWNGRQAWIMLINLTATGIAQFESRQVTACTAMTAGGSATITWDSNWPVTLTNYTKYRIVGQAGSKNDVGRLYNVADPAASTLGLNTFVGAHLVKKSPKVIRYANTDGSFGTQFPLGTVCWSSSGSAPFVEIPATLQPVPSAGQFRFTEPVVKPFGSVSYLQGTGYPTTAANGLPGDVRVLALYSRGAMSVTIPADVAGVAQYQGTAYTVDGLAVTKYIDIPTWIWQNDTVSMTALGQQHLDSIKNTVYEGSIDYIVANGVVPGWDYLSFTQSLNVAINGATSPLSAVNAPVKSVRVKWGHDGDPFTHLISFGFSNRQRPFSGDDLYIHPQFAEGSPLAGITGDGGAFGSDVSASYLGASFGAVTNNALSAAHDYGDAAGNMSDKLSDYGVDAASLGGNGLGGPGQKLGDDTDANTVFTGVGRRNPFDNIQKRKDRQAAEASDRQGAVESRNAREHDAEAERERIKEGNRTREFMGTDDYRDS